MWHCHPSPPVQIRNHGRGVAPCCGPECSASQGSGYAVAALDTTRKAITYHISYSLAGEETAAHIHTAIGHNDSTGHTPAGMPTHNASTLDGNEAHGAPEAGGHDASIMYTFPAGTPGTKHGVWEYENETDVLEIESRFIRGESYIVIHTSSHPDGEIRGHLQARPALQPRYSLVGNLTAGAVPSGSNAYGDVLMNLDTETGRVDFFVDYTPNGSDTVTDTKVHGFSPTGVSSGVLPPGHEIRSSGFMMIDPVQIIGFIDGMTYLQFNTEAHPLGAIRAQLQDVQRLYTIADPNIESTSMADDGVSGLLMPIQTFSKGTGVSVRRQPFQGTPPQGRLAYTDEMRVDLIPHRVPSGPIVFTLAGFDKERREYGSTHINAEYDTPSIYWYNTQLHDWIEAEGTSFDTSKDISVVTLGLEVVSDPAFGWRLVGMRSKDNKTTTPVTTPVATPSTTPHSGAPGSVAPCLLGAYLLLPFLLLV